MSEKDLEKVPISVKLLGITHTFYIRLNSDEDKKKFLMDIENIKEIISNTESYVAKNSRGFTRDKKLAILIFLLAWQLLREKEKVKAMQDKMRSLEMLMELMEKTEQKR